TNLAFLHYKRDDLAGAERILRRTLEMRRNTFGKENVNTAVAAVNLAQILVLRGDYAEAERLYTESLQIQERFGTKSSEILITLEGFAELLRRTSKNVQADDIEARAKLIRADQKYTVKAYR